MSLLKVTDLGKSFGGNRAVDGVTFEVAAGELLALIGPNGAGKTTTFNMVNGQLRPDTGSVVLAGQELVGRKPRDIWHRGVGRTFQIAETFASLTVVENVQMALLSADSRLYSMWKRAADHRRDEALALLEQVGMLEQADRACSVLAYGDVKRVELAIAMANAPKLLLMDEPTAGMAPRERNDLMSLTKRLVVERGMAVLFTEHSMDVVFAHADRLIVLARGRLIAEGRPEHVRNHPKVQEVYFGGGTTFEKKVGLATPSLAERVPTIKPEPFDGLAAGDSKAPFHSRLSPVSVRRSPWSSSPLPLAREGRGEGETMPTDTLLDARRLCAWYGAAQILFDVDLRVNRGEVVALMGRNGAGKSTTLKALMGMLRKRTGAIGFLGNDVSRAEPHDMARLGLGYVPEDRRVFGDLTVMENLEVGRQPARRWADGSAAPVWTAEKLFELFPNLGEMQGRLGSRMSGGEQQMLTVARTLMGNPYLVLLDEPSEGVAPVIVEQMVQMILELKAQGVSILLSEQNMHFAELVSDRAYVLEKGQIRHQATMAELATDDAVRRAYLSV